MLQTVDVCSDRILDRPSPRLLELFPVPVSIWHWPEAVAAKSALLAAVERRRRDSDGVLRTNVNGWHSEFDLPVWPDPEVQRLVRWIAECARQTTRLLNKEGEDFPHWRMNGWANVNPPGSRNRSHHHAQLNWHWSACYYVHLAALETDERLGGALVFEERHTGLAPAGRKGARRTWRHRPAEGELVLFPAWLYHSVEPHGATTARVSTAFNLHGVGLERSRMWQYQPPIIWRKFPGVMHRLARLVRSPDRSRDALPAGTDVKL